MPQHQWLMLPILPSISAGSDYDPISVTLTFPAGALRMCVEIDVIDDTIGEPTESFFVSLTNSNLQISRSQATVTILQDPGDYNTK